jgi:two-component system, NarL family, nitrate/nitrite sensor histidine kinase NarX
MDFTEQRLSTKLTWMAVVFLLVALAGIGFTLLESWKLEGGAAAINDMGSERMRSYRIAFLLSETVRNSQSMARAELPLTMRRLEEVLAMIRRGDPARPLALPRDQAILEHVAEIDREWETRIKPSIHEVLAERDELREERMLRDLWAEMEHFIGRIDTVVGEVEHRNAHHTELLRYMQFGLVALALAGTVALIYLMFMLVVRPVEKLSDGMQRMTHGEFGVRLPVESRDEFGNLAAGFNRMAEHLQRLYADLEDRVASKTHSLEEKNRELAMLYDVATLLNTPTPLEPLCRGFLRKLTAMLSAQAGAVRLIDPQTRDIHLYVHEGFTEDFARGEQCLDMGECLCGQAAQRQKSAVESLAPVSEPNVLYPCQKAGYQTVAIFAIRFRGELLGIFNLYFRTARALTRPQRHMLETLGDNLGIAIENQRLISRVKEMAASDERTLLAQELHDSIAQSLAFLNIEAQMLEDALKHSATTDAQEILAQIRVGIQSSYEDVRELLVHFRTKIKTEDVALTIRQTLEQFESQTGIRTTFTEAGSGVPLPPENHLQVLHILQEALSNVRKHSGADTVDVEMLRDRIYRFRVRDNGKGFDPAATEQKSEGHIGLSIMRERAQRIGGEVSVVSKPGGGTVVTLSLPVAQTVEAAA